MSYRRAIAIGVLLSVLAGPVSAADEAAPAIRLGDLSLLPTAGVEARVTRADGATKMTFRKTGAERRFVALTVPVAAPGAAPASLQSRLRVSLTGGEGPRLAVAALADGGAWFKVGSVPLPVGEWTDAQLPLETLRAAGFNLEPVHGAAIDWGRVDGLWFGLVLDGPAEGTLEVRGLALSDRPYRAARALPVTGQGAGSWDLGKDPSVSASLTVPDEGPGETPCMKVEVTFPGGRHMYMVPTVAAPAVDLEGYSAIQLTYRADLPEGIDGLLLMLMEPGGAQYYADPAPPVAAEWTTLTVPFAAFKLGSWSKDPNGRLDLDQVDRIAVGVHGTATGEGGPGIVRVTGLRFVP